MLNPATRGMGSALAVFRGDFAAEMDGEGQEREKDRRVRGGVGE